MTSPNDLCAFTTGALFEELRKRCPYSIKASTLSELAHFINEFFPDFPVTLDEFQEGVLKTESPIESEKDPKALDRWKDAWLPALKSLNRVRSMIERSKLDKLKKYASYGKIPSDLILTAQDAVPEDRLYLRYAKPDWFAEAPRYDTFRLLHALLGIVTEVEEIIESVLLTCDQRQVKPTSDGMGQHTPREFVTIADFDKTNLLEEVGDLMFYLGLLGNAAGFRLQTAIEANQHKLQVNRYKNGFTNEEAINRDTATEQKSLSLAASTDTGMCVSAAATAAASSSVSNIDPVAPNPTKEMVDDLRRETTRVLKRTKGMFCPDCGSIIKSVNGQATYCDNCEINGEDITAEEFKSVTGQELPDSCAVMVTEVISTPTPPAIVLTVGDCVRSVRKSLNGYVFEILQIGQKLPDGSQMATCRAVTLPASPEPLGCPTEYNLHLAELVKTKG